MIKEKLHDFIFSMKRVDKRPGCQVIYKRKEENHLLWMEKKNIAQQQKLILNLFFSFLSKQTNG